MDIRKFFQSHMASGEGTEGENSHMSSVTPTPSTHAATASGTTSVSIHDESITDGETETSDLGDIEHGPMQKTLTQYPQEQFGVKKRSFRPQWYEKYTWLEYSRKNDAAYCFACRHFRPKQSTRTKQDALWHNGFRNWKRGLDSFKEHETSAVHKESMVAFQDSKVHGDIVQQLQTGSESEIKERREYLRRIVNITMFLAKQGISFRGHDESEDSNNKGNFIECLNLLTEFDPFLSSYNAPSKVSYISPLSQNEVIQCCSEEIKASILDELKSAEFYAIMADEARDNHKEQLTVCVRYVVPATGITKEHFIGFIDLQSFNAESITESLQNFLRENGLDNVHCVAQAYDGASVMSGVSGGVQAKFQKYHPEAIYVHCYAHQLNLVLCHTCKAVKEAKAFFDMLEAIYTFFSVSVINHQQFIDVQKQLGLMCVQLVQLSDTRWSCQVRAVNALIKNFTAVIRCLSESQSPTAIGLLAKLRQISMVHVSLTPQYYRRLSQISPERRH